MSGANPSNVPAIIDAAAVDLAPRLAELVTVVEKPLSNGQTVLGLKIDPRLHQVANVLTRVDEITQPNPNYTPAFKVLTLDVEKHFYKIGSRNNDATGRWEDQLAPLKEGLGEIVRLGGGRLDEVHVESPNPNTVKATARIRLRQSDGTFIPRSDSVMMFVDVAEDEAEENARSSNDRRKTPLAGEELEKYVRLERRRAKKYLPRIAATAAINRATRGAFSIPQKFTREEAERPFVLVAWHYTPDLSDPETRRELVKAEYAVFGSPPAAAAAAALPPASAVDWDTDPQPYTAIPGEVTDPDDDGFSYDDEDPAGEPTGDASAFVVSFGRAFPGRTIGDIHAEGGAKGLSYLRYLAGLEAPDGRSFKADTPQKQAAREAAQAFLHAIDQVDAA